MSFLEGIITFISPCLLPMIPIYLSYFAGQDVGDKKDKTWQNALGFIVGFTMIFILLGAFASQVGIFLKEYQGILNVVFGIIMILFGLNFMGMLHLSFLKQNQFLKINTKQMNFVSSFLFGVIFSVTWSPCIGSFLGSALMLAANTNHMLEGVLMLFCFSLGLGIPFFISAILIQKLKTTFDWIKKHYGVINKICGIFLILMGILMMTGYMRYFLNMLANM